MTLFRILIGSPPAPQIVRADPGVDSKTLLIDWEAQPSRKTPITSFTVIIRVAGSEEEFTVSNSSARTHTIEDYQEEKEYDVVICANNNNNRACSDPFTVPAKPTLPPPPKTTPPKVSVGTPPPIRRDDKSDLPPGLIAGIVVIVVVAVLICCLFLLILLLCFCCRTDSQKTYYPGIYANHNILHLPQLIYTQTEAVPNSFPTPSQ